MMGDSKTQPGVLHLVRSTSTLGASSLDVYRLQGSAVVPVSEIIPADGIGFPPSPRWSGDQPFQLKILHFNDLHGRISHVTGNHSEAVLSRLAHYLRVTRRAVEDDPCSGVLVLAGGDELEGTIYDDLQSDKQTPVHASYRLYSDMGVDAAALGNHELDRGTQRLAASIRGEARFPVLAANLDAPPPLKECVDPAALYVLGGVRVGVIGLLSPGEIIHHRADDFRIAHPVKVAQNLVPLLRPLCDVLILLTHLGRSFAEDSAVVHLAGDAELAESLPQGSVHLIVGAHTHQPLNEHGLEARNLVNGIPILQAGAFGQYLGEATLEFFPEKPHQPALTSVRLIETAGLQTDSLFEEKKVQPLAQRVMEIGTQTLGVVDSANGLDTETVCKSFSTGELPLANFIADGMAARCRLNGYQLDFSMLDHSIVCEGLIPDSVLTYADWFRVMPHCDYVYLYEFEASQLALFLKDNAYRINRRDEADVERGFVYFSADVRYRIIPGKSRFEAQVCDITVGGVPFDLQKKRHFSVAGTSFLRILCNRWEREVDSHGIPLFDVHELPYTFTQLALREQMVEYINQFGGVTSDAGARIDGRLITNKK